MVHRTPRSTLTATRLPYTTLFRSHAGAVNALANLNVIAGTSATRFQPNRFVTRAQAASMTARLLRLAGALPDGPDAFTDDQGSVHEASINSLAAAGITGGRSEEHTSELQSLMRISYAVFCLKKKTTQLNKTIKNTHNKTPT